MKRFLIGLVASLLISSTSFAANFTSSLTLNESNPVVLQNVTFTAIYPSEAARQSRQPQYPDQPSIQVDCSQTIDSVTTRIMSGHAFIDPKQKQKIRGGWLGVTYPLNLSANGGNGFYWQSGAASCNAILYSFDVNNVGHVWATVPFEVSAQ